MARAASGTAWKPLDGAELLASVVDVTTQEGALLELQDSAAQVGLLWLKPGSQARIGRGADGAPRAVVSAGAARLRWETPDGEVRDVLHIAGAATEILTAEHPEASAWSFAVGDGGEAAGVGTLAVRQSGQLAYLELRELEVRGALAGDMIEMRVEHAFVNPTEARLEGTFRFPVPSGALVTGLELEVDGEMRQGEVVEREKAQRVYDQIVDGMQDPAILEWEGGNTFKLRVFPLEPSQPKRVAIRYLMPLRRGPDGWLFAYPTAAPEMQQAIGRFRLSLDGQTVVDESSFVPGRTIEVPIAKAPATVQMEETADARYYALRLEGRELLASRRVERAAQPPRDLVLIVDTSRSMLEEKGLLRASVDEILRGLGRHERFVVVAHDLEARSHAGGLVSANPDQIARAMAFLDEIEPDGASDLGAALDLAGSFGAGQTPGRSAQVVLLGDGHATWGATNPDALVVLARERLGGVPFFALAVGKQADEELLARITSAQDGFVAVSGTLAEVRGFEALLGSERALPRLQRVEVAAVEGASILPEHLGTVLPGTRRTVLIKVPKSQQVPEKFEVRAAGGWSRSIGTGPAEAAHGVARRWAAAEIARLEQLPDQKDAVVALSRAFRVLSRHTAWLVLESEEMYKRFQIERSAPETAGAPRVTGADLTNLADAGTSLEPDHIQPGDPEIRIPAPADARSVVVELPFGDTKEAAFEPELRAWTVRFLIAHDTPNGKYEVTVHIVHADGRTETLRLPYWVDTTAPTVTVTVRPRRRSTGTYEIRAEQVVTELEWQQSMPGTTRSAAAVKRSIQILADVRRVEVGLPDGQVLALTALGSGRFRGFWKPATPLAGPVTLRIVAVDTALNPSVTEVQMGPQGLLPRAR
jgi:hypothetical protein